MKKIIKWGLIVFVGLIVLGGIIGALSGDSTPSTTNTSTTSNNSGQNAQEPEAMEEPSEPETVQVELAALVEEFDKNQLAAEDKYEGKWIETTGYIGNISEDIIGSYFIILNPSNEEYYFGTSVQCYFENKSDLTSLENGQQVTVRGKVDTQVSNVLVKECSVVN